MPSNKEMLDELRTDLQRQQLRIRELEQQLADAVEGKMPEDVRLEPCMIWMESMVASQTGKPMVIFRWMTHVAQFTVAQARRHAIDVMRVCDAAESDAFLCDFFRTKLEAEPQVIGGIIQEFRLYRDRREQEEQQERDKENEHDTDN